MNKDEVIAVMLKGLQTEGKEMADAFEINWDLVDSTDEYNIETRTLLLKALRDLHWVESEYVYSLTNPKTHKPHMGKNQYAGYVMDLADRLVDAYAAREVYGKIAAIADVSGTPLGPEWDLGAWEEPVGRDWEDELGG